MLSRFQSKLFELIMELLCQPMKNIAKSYVLWYDIKAISETGERMKLLTTAITIDDIQVFANAGADGLIFGTAFFSLRAAAVFDEQKLSAIAKRCHECNIEMRVLVNRMFDDHELIRVREHLLYLKEIGVDGIYFSDEAVLAIAADLNIIHLLIYQSDTLLTNHMDVDYYLAEGLKGTVLAKEITLDEIAAIAHASDASRLELIGHGYLVMMHSRRKLLSNYMEHLKRNDKLSDYYHLTIEEATRHEAMPIYEDAYGTHVFSAFVQQSFTELEQFMKANIGALRIDGIFQTSAEIAFTLSLYDRLRKHELDGQEAKEAYRSHFPRQLSNGGFYYQATGTSK